MSPALGLDVEGGATERRVSTSEVLRQPFRAPSPPAVFPAGGLSDLWLSLLFFLRISNLRKSVVFPYMTNRSVTNTMWLTPASLRTPLPPEQHSTSEAGAGEVLRVRELGNPLSPPPLCLSSWQEAHWGKTLRVSQMWQVLFSQGESLGT